MFYQLKVIRKKTKPPIWRRVVIPSNITFAQLAMILEKLLEYECSNNYQFEFYSAKVRLVEWCEERKVIPDFYYSYYNAPDTYINKWMTDEKTFSFQMLNDEDVFPEYRVEIEKVIEKLEIKTGKSSEKVNSPIIIKQVSDTADLYWSDPNIINDEMKRCCFLKKGKDEYQYTSEIMEQINKGEGIGYSVHLNDRDIHTKKSANAQLKEFAELFRQKTGMANNNEILSKASDDESKQGFGKIKLSKPTRRECKLEAFLKSYDKEELIELAEELGITSLPKRKDKMAYEIARHLLDAPIMKARLLQLDEEELDAFEAVIENGPFIPNDSEWDRLYPVYDLSYLSSYSDHTVQVPDEVIFLYQNIQRKGYREYHRKASWLLKCIRVACYLYMSIPLDVLFQLYIKNNAVRVEYGEFCELLKTLPENVSDCVLNEDKLIYREIYTTGTYKHLEIARHGDFYIPSKKEIEILESDRYPSYERAYQSLSAFLHKELNYPLDFSIYLCQLAYQTFSGGGLMSDYMRIINGMEIEFKSEKGARKFATLMMDVNNETRMIEFKGHKPNEMRSFDTAIKNPEKVKPQQKSEKKIYPNDPCPCGSGKKYKKCCGR